MPNERDLSTLADPRLEQYFLVSPEKLSKLIAAAGITLNDHVVELGAGAGTVARVLPPSASLTVIELDERLIQVIRKSVPSARVLQGDALELIQNISCDVLIGNLPNAVTETLLDLLPRLAFRTAVLAVGESSNLDRLGSGFSWSEIATITGNDFNPPQPSVSRLVRVVPLGDSPQDRASTGT